MILFILNWFLTKVPRGTFRGEFMGWLGKLFGSDSALESGSRIAEKATTGIISGIDKAFYTDEEKADINLKMVDMSSKVLLGLQDQFTPRAISRRIIAFLFSISFCAAFITAIIFACLDDTSIVDNIVHVVKVFDMGVIMGTIIIFYFGNYLMDKFLKKEDHGK